MYCLSMFSHSVHLLVVDCGVSRSFYLKNREQRNVKHYLFKLSRLNIYVF